MAKTNSDGYNLSLKVSPKGGVQLDGLRRWPVVFYADEWEAMISRGEAIRNFIKTNRSKLSTKEDKKAKEGGTSI